MKLPGYILIFSVSIFLCACPYSSAYKLDDEPSINIDDMLLGSWACFVKKASKNKEEPVKLVFSRRNDFEYNLAITGYIDELKPFHIIANDSIKGTAFMSTLLNKQFLNIEIHSRTYIAEIKLENNLLSIQPISENFTAMMVRENASLRAMLEYHYKSRTRALYEEEFCLREMVKVK
jgi:hypothetical protein